MRLTQDMAKPLPPRAPGGRSGRVLVSEYDYIQHRGPKWSPTESQPDPERSEDRL